MRIIVLALAAALGACTSSLQIGVGVLPDEGCVAGPAGPLVAVRCGTALMVGGPYAATDIPVHCVPAPARWGVVVAECNPIPAPYVVPK